MKKLYAYEFEEVFACANCGEMVCNCECKDGEWDHSKRLRRITNIGIADEIDRYFLMHHVEASSEEEAAEIVMQGYESF